MLCFGLLFGGRFRTLALATPDHGRPDPCGCVDLSAQVGHGGGSELVVNPATPEPF